MTFLSISFTGILPFLIVSLILVDETFIFTSIKCMLFAFNFNGGNFSILLIVLILIQSFVSRWSHAQSTRRDFVLQMLARHRRNMSRYLVRLVAHMWAVSF